MLSTHFARLPGFYDLPIDDRFRVLAERLSLSEQDAALFKSGITLDRLDAMVENAVGAYALPFAVAPNFIVDGVPVLVPMVTEEPSIVAAASYMGKLVASCGGFVTQVDLGLMEGQIQILDCLDLEKAQAEIETNKQALIDLANTFCEPMLKRGGGCVDVRVELFAARQAAAIEFQKGFLVVYFLVDCRDAMGANLINTVMEGVADKVCAIAQGRANFRILSNLCDKRIARAQCSVPFAALASSSQLDQAETVARNIMWGYELAMRDPYRAATHNKGILNGIDAVAVATGNDFRAIEAGAHAYAAHKGSYVSLSHYEIDFRSRMLTARLELPLSVGTVGGAARAHPMAALARLMLQEKGQSAQGVASVMAAVGLAQNLAAMRALASEGIQRGHMALHRRKEEPT